jgi:hypothetical protein
LPQSASAQAGEEAVPKVALAIHTQHRLPPQLMLRASYYLYLDADADNGATSDQTEPNAEEPAQPTQPTPSRLERWHPEAFVDPSQPASEPALKLEVDSTALEVTPTAPPTLKELERREEEKKRRRRLGLGLGLGVGLVVLVVLVGAAATAAAW